MSDSLSATQTHCVPGACAAASRTRLPPLIQRMLSLSSIGVATRFFSFSTLLRLVLASGLSERLVICVDNVPSGVPSGAKACTTCA